MQFTIEAGFAQVFSVAAFDAAGNPAKAKLSNFRYSSSDTSVCTTDLTDTASGNFTLTGVAAGAATVVGTATATEPDGSAHDVQGSIAVTVGAPPVTAPPAATLVFTPVGPPTPIVPPPPPPPPTV